MVSMIGAPALTLGGLALMGIAVPSALVIWHGAFNAFLLNPFEVAP
jgi:flagellar biosynthesis protein FliR